MTYLSDYMGESVTIEWSVIYSGTAEIYVDEKLTGVAGKTRWGPLPSKQLAHALITERRDVFQNWTSAHWPRVQR